MSTLALIRPLLTALVLATCGAAITHRTVSSGPALIETQKPRRDESGARSFSSPATLLLGLMNGTTERRLYNIHQHTGRAKLIGSVKDDESYPYQGRCLMAVDEKNSLAFLLNTSHALLMSLDSGKIVTAYRREASVGSFSIFFWNKTNNYFLQAVQTFQPPEQNFTRTCWAGLTQNGTLFGADCQAFLDPPFEYPEPCVFQHDDADGAIWYSSVSPYQGGQVFFVAATIRNDSHGFVDFIWAGATGMSYNELHDARACYARDANLKKTFGITRDKTNTSSQLIEILPGNLSNLDAAPHPKHLINLPGGLLLDKSGACAYNATLHTFYLFMSGELNTGQLGSRAGDHDVAFHWLVMVNTESLEMQTKALSDLPNDFIGLQVVMTTDQTEQQDRSGRQ